jgi:hypothetical protein
MNHLTDPARSSSRVPARRWRGVAAGIGVGMVSATCSLLILGLLALATPAPSAAAQRDAAVLVAGSTAHIVQPGMTDWPIPVDRRAYDEYNRGFQESDDEAIEHAFAAFEWITVSDGQAVRIIEVDGEAHRVEVLEGRDVGRRGWLKARHLGP